MLPLLTPSPESVNFTLLTDPKDAGGRDDASWLLPEDTPFPVDAFESC